MKRFWTVADVAAEGDAHVIRLDGTPMRLPGGDVLRVPCRALADAIATEWGAAGGGALGGALTAADTPLTGLAGTAQLRIAPDPAPTVAALAAYAGSDLLCYRADAPGVLIAREDTAWQPWLDWAAETFDAPLISTNGVVHVAQDPLALARLRDAVARLGPYSLAGLGLAVPLLGSLVLGLALLEGALDAAEAHRLVTLDEAFQAETWGEDDEAVARRAGNAAEVALAERFLRLTGSA